MPRWRDRSPGASRGRSRSGPATLASCGPRRRGTSSAKRAAKLVTVGASRPSRSLRGRRRASAEALSRSSSQDAATARSAEISRRSHVPSRNSTSVAAARVRARRPEKRPQSDGPSARARMMASPDVATVARTWNVSSRPLSPTNSEVQPGRKTRMRGVRPLNGGLPARPSRAPRRTSARRPASRAVRARSRRESVAGPTSRCWCGCREERSRIAGATPRSGSARW
jgi:hypothetical protein